ncbi:PAS domain S-box protein [Roseomonas populi]|uniref:histidine kinase n=1 Tax=Roseomonas populi TaxID=3121582 RepID=A0ABT1X6W2_9PROT|nr:PAS domain S-box protein [Roseomonas pecuniae]MCR0983842.1 PAS domain S-box protein [Roseomonas pecuniae]
MPDVEQMIQRQKALADFGEFVLHCEDLDEILHEACRLVGETLGTGRAKILEIQEGGKELFVRAGVGWAEGVVGHLRLQIEEHSSETYSIEKRVPVVTQDISKEDRFEVPEFMKVAGVVALANAPILLPGGRAYGLLQVDDTEPRDFGEEDTEFLRTYTIILGPLLDRLLKVGELRRSEERFRLMVEEAQDYAIFTTDRDDRIVDWLPGAAAVFGWSAEEVEGKPADILFSPEDRQAGEAEREVETARARGHAPNVRWHVRKDGSPVFIEGAVRALKDGGGSVTGFIKIGQDVTERRASETALAESLQLLRALVEGVPQLVWRAGHGGEWTWSSPQWTAYTGLSAEESQGMGWLRAMHPDDREGVHSAWAKTEAGAPLKFEGRLFHQGEGRYRWFRTRATPVRGEDGQVVEWLGTSTDVDDLRRLQDQQEVMIAELQHRTRNLIGVVQSTFTKTLKGSTSLQDLRARFNDRLAALSRVQGLLSQLAGSERVDFGEMVRAELSGHGALEEPGKVILEGPPGVRLRSGAVQTFALALHELATNAVKYGALQQPAGRLRVSWRLVPVAEGGEPWLWVEWRESGVRMPEVSAPVPGGGYGRELIERALPYQLGARTTYELGAVGVICTIAAPVVSGAA